MQDNAAVVRRFVEEVINRGNMESAVQFVWEDVVEQVPLPGQGPGLEGLKDILRTMRSAFPDLDFSIKEQIAEGDKVVCRNIWRWTDPASGKKMQFHGFVLWRFEGAKIAERWATVTPPACIRHRMGV